jgi:hypothetical protein
MPFDPNKRSGVIEAGRIQAYNATAIFSSFDFSVDTENEKTGLIQGKQRSASS